MKKPLFLLLLSTIILAGCNNDTSTSNPPAPQDSTGGDVNSSTTSPEEPIDVDELNPLQRVFYNLSQGNFSVDYTLNYASSGQHHQTASYTTYAIETDGFFGFSSVAQGDDLIFSYERENHEIVSSAPLLNSSSGLRYTSISDYRPTFAGIELDKLPTEADENGYYTYEFGKSSVNDEMIARIGMLYSSIYNTSEGNNFPTSVKLLPIGNSLKLEGIGLVYDAEQGIQDTVVANFNQIGDTEISDVKTYLDEGGTAKDFVSDRFVAFFLPYLVSHNYSLDVDLSDMDVASLEIPQYKTKYTEDTEFNISPNSHGYGYLQYQNTVYEYDVDDNDDIVFGMAAGNSGSEAFTDLWAEEIGTSFADLNAALLVGYMTEEDGKEVYHLTDSQFISAITNLAKTGSGDQFYVDEVTITIDDYEAGDFTCNLEYYDRTNHVDRGTTVVKFYDRDETVVEPVERLYLTDDPTPQNKDDFIQALKLFKGNNYSQYVPSDFYMTEYTYTPNYTYFYYTNSDYTSGRGFILQDDGVHNVNITETGVDVGSAINVTLPGTSDRYGTDIDAAYLSAPTIYTSAGEVDVERTAALQAAFYNPDNYEIFNNTYNSDASSWVIDDQAVIDWANDYFSSILGSTLKVYQIGIRTHLQGDDPSTKMNKLDYYLYVYDDEGSLSYTYFSFFNLGHANIPQLDEYLENQNN